MQVYQKRLAIGNPIRIIEMRPQIPGRTPEMKMDDDPYTIACSALEAEGRASLPLRALPPEALRRKNGAPFFSRRAAASGALELRPPRNDSIARRAFRRLLAAALMVALSPIFLAVSLCILAADGRPVFFSQRREGLGGRPFGLLKFRTMRVAPGAREGDPLDKREGDPRVTRLGAFLRRFSLDELPQLVNIARGEMAFVGPRPLPVGDLRPAADWQAYRLRVPPGLTGLWQVTMRNRSTAEDLCRIDFAYACSRSLRLDLAILLATVPEVFGGGGR